MKILAEFGENLGFLEIFFGDFLKFPADFGDFFGNSVQFQADLGQNLGFFGNSVYFLSDFGANWGFFG